MTTNISLSGASSGQINDFVGAYQSGVQGQNNAAWGGVGINLATGVLNGILGYKNYRLAKKDLKQQRSAMNINLAQQTDSHNQYKVQKAYQTGKYGSIEEARLATHDQGMLLDTRQLGDSRNPIAQREAQLARDREAVAAQQAAALAAAATPLPTAPAAPGILGAPDAVNAQSNTNKEDELKKNRL